jgi:predicted RNase H-like HicB family nuclease
MKDHYMFPAVFEYTDTGVSVYFPDIPGAVTTGENDFHALQMAKEVLAFAIYDLEEQGQEIPSPSSPQEIATEDPTDKIVYVDVWMKPIRDELANKVVTKNCTLPKWLRDAGEKAGLNFSQLLQSAVKEALGVKEK